eukprot:12876644-Ditylum_brightwellii.AAC.1
MGNNSKKSSSWMADAGGLPFVVVEDKGNSEVISLGIIAPVVGEFDCCDATGVVRSNLLGENE